MIQAWWAHRSLVGKLNKSTSCQKEGLSVDKRLRRRSPRLLWHLQAHTILSLFLSLLPSIIRLFSLHMLWTNCRWSHRSSTSSTSISLPKQRLSPTLLLLTSRLHSIHSLQANHQILYSKRFSFDSLKSFQYQTTSFGSHPPDQRLHGWCHHLVIRSSTLLQNG